MKSFTGYPVTDVSIKDDKCQVIEMALTGFTKEQVNIEIDATRKLITISAKSDASKDENCCRIAKRSFTKFFKDAGGILDIESIIVSFENGLLVITIPRLKKVMPQKVQIQ